MLVAIIFILLFPLIGLQFVARFDSCRILLSPSVGIGATVLLGYAISAWIGLSGSTSFAAAIVILLLTTIAQGERITNSIKLNSRLVGSDLLLALIACIASLILVLPSFQYGVHNFFGVINFDFFYNSQDSFYLTNHSVLDFNTGANDSITPLNWSANQQGRFAISIIASFINKLFGMNTLQVNSILLTCLVFFTAITVGALARYVLNLNLCGAALSTFVYILSGGYAQGYSYYLLGQISAIPTLLLILIYLNDLLVGGVVDEKRPADLPNWNAIVMLALLINVIFVQYAILFFFSILIIVAATCVNCLYSYRIRRPIIFSHTAFALLGAGFVFLIMRINSLVEAKKILLDWVNISIRTSSRNISAPAVFSEYTAEAFFALLTGVIKYPTNISILSPFLGFGSNRSWIILVAGVIMLIFLLYLVVTYIISLGVTNPVKSIVVVVTSVTIIPSLIFYCNQSGYAIFKIGSWLIPVMLIFTVAATYHLQFSKRRYKYMQCAIFISLVGANILTGLNYSWCFLKGLELESYENTKNINGLKGVDALLGFLEKTPQKTLLFDFCDGIKTAWVVNEFRNWEFNVLTHNFQPLEDRILMPSVDVRNEINFSDYSFLINDRIQESHRDIISINPAPIPVFFNEYYNVYEIHRLDYYAYIGRGSYPQTNLTLKEALAAGIPQTFRWIENGVEIFVYSKHESYIDIEFELTSGYLNVPKDRTIQITGEGILRTESFQNKLKHIRFSNIKINQGVTRFVIESNDSVQRLPRYGALFREFVNFDFRLLNFAIGNLNIVFKSE